MQFQLNPQILFMLQLLTKSKLAIDYEHSSTGGRQQPLQNLRTETFVKFQIAVNQLIQDVKNDVCMLIPPGFLKDAVSSFAQSILM